jgi:hypothetical protein
MHFRDAGRRMDATRFARLFVGTTLAVLALLGCSMVTEDPHPDTATDLGQPAANPGSFGANAPNNEAAEPGSRNTPSPNSTNPIGSTPVGTGEGTSGGIPGGAGLGATGTGGGNATSGGTIGSGLPITGGGVPGGAGLGSTGTGTSIPSPVDAGPPNVIVVD